MSVEGLNKKWKDFPDYIIGISTNLRFFETVTVFGDTKMTTAALSRLTHQCHFLKTGNDSFRLKAQDLLI